MASYKVDKKKCMGCGACVAVCPEGIKMNEEGKAEVTDSKKLEKCGGESVCPVEAIKKA
jgi:ferredoxin